MKYRICKLAVGAVKYLPVLMLVILFSSMTIVTFHTHNCNENSDNCIACNLQQTFSSLAIESTVQTEALPPPTTESIVILNERITDPSQKVVCSSHAPPQFG